MPAGAGHAAKGGERLGLFSTHTVHVLWPDCDPAGIVFYGNYFRWMDNATFFLFDKAGLRWDVLMGEYGVPGVPLVSAHADFVSPAKFGEVLTVESHVFKCGTTSFTVSHRFVHGERITAEGWEKRVWCTSEPGNPSNLTAVPIPAEVRVALGWGESPHREASQAGQKRR